MDVDYRTSSYGNEAGSGETARGFVSSPPAAATTGEQAPPPWLSTHSQSQSGASVQNDYVRRLMDLSAEPTGGFRSEYYIICMYRQRSIISICVISDQSKVERTGALLRHV